MLTRQESQSAEVRLREPVPTAPEDHQLCLYYIRLHKAKDDFTLKASFINHINFTFSKGKRLYNNDDFGPFIYTLKLNFRDKDKHFYVQDQGQNKPVGEYHLEISRTTSIHKTVSHSEEGSQGHSLQDCFDSKNHFLFGIRFSTKYGTHLPGKNFKSIISEKC